MMIGMITFGSFFASIFGIAFLELQTRRSIPPTRCPPSWGCRSSAPCRSSGPHPPAEEGSRPADGEGSLLAKPLARIGRRDPNHAGPCGPHRVAPGGDDRQCRRGEGKTSLSTYLATSLARSGMRTLLIDADLRSPSIHRLYDLPAAAGLSEVLRGEVEWPMRSVRPPLPTCTSWPPGDATGRPSACSRRAASVLSSNELKERFDFVIVDSSPILPVADGLIIAQHVDAVLFSIFRDVSSKTKVPAASSGSSHWACKSSGPS